MRLVFVGKSATNRIAVNEDSHKDVEVYGKWIKKY